VLRGHDKGGDRVMAGRLSAPNDSARSAVWLVTDSKGCFTLTPALPGGFGWPELAESVRRASAFFKRSCARLKISPRCGAGPAVLGWCWRCRQSNVRKAALSPCRNLSGEVARAGTGMGSLFYPGQASSVKVSVFALPSEVVQALSQPARRS